MKRLIAIEKVMNEAQIGQEVPAIAAALLGMTMPSGTHSSTISRFANAQQIGVAKILVEVQGPTYLIQSLRW